MSTLFGLMTAGIHRDLEQLFDLSRWTRLPDCAALNRLWGSHVSCSAVPRLRFVPQDEQLPFAELSYAQRVAREGLIATRPNNWHDIFNALTWVLFPQTKYGLMLRLADNSNVAANLVRTAEQNALTLFDECAVLLVVSDPDFKPAHEQHDWHTLFVRQRACWGVSIRPLVLGHGFYDQARRPYVGLTAKAWYVNVTRGAMSIPPGNLCAVLDQQLAEQLPGTLISARQLLPLPVLGVPGWWPANADPAFYDNSAYFRARSTP